jgi:hypothetical protein
MEPAGAPLAPAVVSRTGEGTRMQPYANKSGNSGITSFELDDDAIVVWFTSGEGYLYGAERPGKAHVEAMRQRALEGVGLATYINQYVRDRYTQKL